MTIAVVDIFRGRMSGPGPDVRVDAEHPKVIPMDLPLSHQVPSRPITRARARALETEVASLLSHFHFDAHETGYYLIQTLCAYSGIMEKLRSKEKRNRKMDVTMEKKK